MVPQMIECELRHELVNIVNPGDAVYVTGIVEVNSQKGYSTFNTGINAWRQHRATCLYWSLFLTLNFKGSYNNRHVKKHTLYIDVVSMNKISNSEEIDQEYAPFITEDLCLIHDIVGVSSVFKVNIWAHCIVQV